MDCAVGRFHGGARSVDSNHVGGDVADARRIEQLLQRDSAWGEVGLVVADPDVVIRLRADDDDIDLALSCAQFVEPSGSAKRGPQTGEAGPENENAFGRRHCHIVTLRRTGYKCHTVGARNGIAWLLPSSTA